MATGNTLLMLNAKHFVGPTTNGATLDTRNNHDVLDFDTTTQETAYADGLVLPSNYAGGGLTVDINTMASTATSGTIAWGLSIERGNTDLDADSLGAETLSSAVTVNATAGIPFTITIAITSGANMDGLLVGEPFRLMLRRSVATDSAAGDAEFWSMHIKET